MASIRFSARPPPRCTTGTDFQLWITRVEMYFEEAEVTDGKQGRELLALLDDGSFRLITQLGLLHDDYPKLKSLLKEHFTPTGNELEYQCQLQARYQKEGESLFEFVGELRTLADLAYPEWKPSQRLDMARNQFVRGIMSPSI